jgi:hypothetical protein
VEAEAPREQMRQRAMQESMLTQFHDPLA